MKGLSKSNQDFSIPPSRPQSHFNFNLNEIDCLFRHLQLQFSTLISRQGASNWNPFMSQISLKKCSPCRSLKNKWLCSFYNKAERATRDLIKCESISFFTKFPYKLKFCQVQEKLNFGISFRGPRFEITDLDHSKTNANSWILINSETEKCCKWRWEREKGTAQMTGGHQNLQLVKWESWLGTDSAKF